MIAWIPAMPAQRAGYDVSENTREHLHPPQADELLHSLRITRYEYINASHCGLACVRCRLPSARSMHKSAIFCTAKGK